MILPDNDDDGECYATDVAAIIGELGATVRVVRFDDSPPKGDVADLFEKCNDASDRVILKERIVSLAGEAKPNDFGRSLTSATEPDGYVPFPVAILPAPIADFVQEAAAAVGVEAAYVALPVLTLLGAAIGNTRRLRMKRNHEAPAILWTGIVGPSGTGKSPALRIALKAARDHEARLRKREEGGRFVVTDTTTEALAQLMADNPRGMLCVHDELAGWLGSIDRYKSQKQRCSADQAFLLSTFDGDHYSIDRRTGDQRHLHIPKASLWVTGGIQPSVLANFMGNAEREAGLLARLVLASPPPQPLTYSQEEVTASTEARFEEVVSRLFALEGDEVVHPAEEAKLLWIKFHDQTAKEMLGLPPDLAAAWSKAMGTALRIALILHLASPSGDSVSLKTMEQAVSLTEWFKHEAKRIYRSLGFSVVPVQQARRPLDDELLAWIKNRADGVSVRDIQRTGPRKFRQSGVAEASIHRLAAAGMVRRVDACHGDTRHVALDHDAAAVDKAIPLPATEPNPAAVKQPRGETTWIAIPRN